MMSDSDSKTKPDKRATSQGVKETAQTFSITTGRNQKLSKEKNTDFSISSNELQR